MCTEKYGKLSRYIVRPAVEEDSPAMAELYKSITYDGSIDLQFLRGADPYQSIKTEGQDAVILLCEDTENNRLIGMGACCIHEMYADGEVKSVGYLNGLKIHPDYQKKALILPRAFAAMGKALQGRADLCFASILSSAKQTQKTFEKSHRSMPAYAKQCRYTTFCIRPAKHSGQLERGNTEGIELFYRRLGPCYNLFPVHAVRGIREEDIIVWREDGRIRACCAILDEREYKGYYLNGYHGLMRLLRKLPSTWFGYPPFPKEHQTVNAAVMSMLLFDENVTVRERRRFIREASAFAGEHDICMIGVTDTDPTYRAFRGTPHVEMESFLYTVNWNEEQCVTGRTIYGESAIM